MIKRHAGLWVRRKPDGSFEVAQVVFARGRRTRVLYKECEKGVSAREAAEKLVIAQAIPDIPEA